MMNQGLKWLVLLGFAGLMGWGMWGLPDRGDLDAPMNEKTTITGTPTPAAHYIEHAYKEAKTPNIVTVVLEALIPWVRSWWYLRQVSS